MLERLRQLGLERGDELAAGARITASRKVSQPVLEVPAALSVSDCLKA
jgi:hypothetical protein